MVISFDFFINPLPPFRFFGDEDTDVFFLEALETFLSASMIEMLVEVVDLVRSTLSIADSLLTAAVLRLDVGLIEASSSFTFIEVDASLPLILRERIDR